MIAPSFWLAGARKLDRGLVYNERRVAHLVPVIAVVRLLANIVRQMVAEKVMLAITH